MARDFARDLASLSAVDWLILVMLFHCRVARTDQIHRACCLRHDLRENGLPQCREQLRRLRPFGLVVSVWRQAFGREGLTQLWALSRDGYAAAAGHLGIAVRKPTARDTANAFARKNHSLMLAEMYASLQVAAGVAAAEASEAGEPPISWTSGKSAHAAAFARAREGDRDAPLEGGAAARAPALDRGDRAVAVLHQLRHDDARGHPGPVAGADRARAQGGARGERRDRGGDAQGGGDRRDPHTRSDPDRVSFVALLRLGQAYDEASRPRFPGRGERQRRSSGRSARGSARGRRRMWSGHRPESATSVRAEWGYGARA